MGVNEELFLMLDQITAAAEKQQKEARQIIKESEKSEKRFFEIFLKKGIDKQTIIKYNTITNKQHNL